MSDLERPESDVLDRVIADCRELSLKGTKHVEVTVTKACGKNFDGDEPVSFGVNVVYKTVRSDLKGYPIERTETIANLTFDPKNRGYLDNPGFMTRDSNVMTEARLQIFARLIHLAALQRAGIAQKVFYEHTEGKPPVEVTDDVIMALSGGATIPSEIHSIYDKWSA